MSRSSDSDVPPSPEPADDHDSIIPGLEPVQPDRSDLAPGADMAAPGDPAPRQGGRGWMLAFTAGGVALVVVVAVLVLSRHGGQPGTVAAGTGQATTAPGQAGAAAGRSPQSRQSAAVSPAGALPSAPNGVSVTATGRGSTSQPPPVHTGSTHATAPTTIGPPRSHSPAAPVDPGTSGELPPLAEPPASPTDPPNPVPPVPADRTVSVSRGPAIQSATGTCDGGVVCYSFNVSIADFPAHAALAYTCADGGGVWWGPTSTVNSGTIVTNSSGEASFITYCVHPLDGATITINVGGGGLSASGKYTTQR